MKTDTYSKAMLTIIAVCLSMLVVKNFIPSANAGMTPNVDPNAHYGLVPLNPDGSVDVNLKSTDTYMKVDLRKIEGVNLNSSKIKYSTVKLPVYIMNQTGGSGNGSDRGDTGNSSGGGRGGRN